MKVDAIAFGGKGVVRKEGKVIFVPDVCRGEDISLTILKEKKRFAEGILTSVDVPSDERVKPRCVHFGVCGGCQLQHMSYKEQLEIKKGFIRDGIERIGKVECPDITLVASENQWHYRKHIRLNLVKDGKGFSAAYIDRTGNPFAPAECTISQHDPLFFTDLHDRLPLLDNSGIESGSLRIFMHEEKPVLAFSFAPKSPSNAKEWSDTSCITLFRSPLGTLYASKESIPFSPFGFMQCNKQVSQAIQMDVLTLAQNKRNILDAYGGDGALAAQMIENGASVTLVEQNRVLTNIAKKRDLEKLTVIQSPVETAQIQGNYDFVYLNPPREGASREALENVLQLRPAQIVYLSCNPTTLGRDIGVLSREGYSVTSVKGFDMFPQTTHVETLVVLKK